MVSAVGRPPPAPPLLRKGGKASAVLALVVGCGATRATATPAAGEPTEPLEQWVEVATPPPTVEVEEIPARPSAAHVWVDGQWAYQDVSSRWSWEQGRWCVPPPATLYYAPARVARERRAITGPDGQPVRSSRWNEMLKQGEQFDLQADRWRWHRGAFYVRGADGRPVAYAGAVTCG